jgi:hypothetical protein
MAINGTTVYGIIVDLLVPIAATMILVVVPPGGTGSL